MQVFLTGATGYIGSAVLESFLRAGHDVTALVRDPEKAESIARRGVHPVIGDLDKPSSYASEAERSDVIVHTALDGSSRRDKIDRQAIETFLGAATSRAASGRPSAFVYTSGVWVLGDTPGPVAEDAPVKPTPSSPGAPNTSESCSMPAAPARPGPSSCARASSTAAAAESSRIC